MTLMKEKIGELLGKTVSVLIDVNRNHILKESYSGIFEEIGEDYVVVDLNNPKFYIKRAVFKLDLILSVWEYAEKK